MRKLSRWIPIIAGAVAGAIVALVIANGSSSTRTVTTTVTQSGGTAVTPTSFSSGKGMSVNQIYRAASPGVVDIVVTQNGQGQGLFGGGGLTKGEGAGVVYNRGGDILTDEHVVAGATSVKVNLQDGKQYTAKVLGTDASDDVGVIHIDAPSSELHPIALADSSTARVGDAVVAIGSPFGLPETTTSGIVSQTGRSITAPNDYTIPNAIQTDAAINPGNSGGPLLDASGRVLGLNDQIETNNQTAGGEGSSSGVGFAIPSDTVKRIAEGIINGHPVKHPYLGVGLNPSPTGGAQIGTIRADTPATAAGLRQGDVITAIDGTTVTDTDQLIARLDNYAPGDTVTLRVRRQGQTMQVKVTLGARPAQAQNGG
ncbi:MAG: trypsin-like peptidase domain-containing protein [Solirubrobacterales bacterium]|nr:trypsin-like peptidase domain-containing protein [Solirubrobacterales bacterium]